MIQAYLGQTCHIVGVNHMHGMMHSVVQYKHTKLLYYKEGARKRKILIGLS